MPEDMGWLATLTDVAVVACAGPLDRARAIRRALARQDGEIKPLVTDLLAPERYVLERLLCVDTTAAGGNASLLAGSGGVGSMAASAGGM
jgi:RHH-type proline utilization regulon transcriptional repressor/proline dehydrogenase/delta 1-pyrroline-5-carboxylate dehydrogenase